MMATRMGLFLLIGNDSSGTSCADRRIRGRRHAPRKNVNSVDFVPVGNTRIVFAGTRQA